MRDHLSLQFSRVMATQVQLFESALVRAAGLVAADDRRELQEQYHRSAVDLEQRRKALEGDAGYYLTRYREIASRLETVSTELYKQFGVSLDQWERSGFPQLTSGGLGLTGQSPGMTPFRSGSGIRFGSFASPMRGNMTPSSQLSAGMANLGGLGLGNMGVSPSFGDTYGQTPGMPFTLSLRAEATGAPVTEPLLGVGLPLGMQGAPASESAPDSGGNVAQ